jgi:hypothetical protein
MLSQRALNRALLARQMLLERVEMSVGEAIAHLVGMQAQEPFPPYFGLWTRLAGFEPEELSRLLIERKAVRLVTLRGTVHLHTAEDCLDIRPLVQEQLTRLLLTGSIYGKGLQGIDLDAVVAAGRAHLDAEPMPMAALRARLAEQWPDRAPADLGAAVHYLAPLVQLPPRAVWGQRGRPVLTTAEQWLSRPLNPHPSMEQLVKRYLAAFGPASVADFQAWSGLTRQGDVFARLRPELISFRDERGRELFDLPEAPRPDADTPAPIRFMPEFDNLLLGHADRTRVISEEHRKRLWTVNGLVPGTILIDGIVQGSWKLRQDKQCATLTLTPFISLTPEQRRELEDEGEDLFSFAAEPAQDRVMAFESV